MRHHIVKSFLISILCILFIGGCKGDNTHSANSLLIGTWTRLFNGTNVSITLKFNGSYAVYMTDSMKADVMGKYTVENDQVTFRDEAGKNASSMGEAVYSFMVTDNQLTLTPINEPDENRKSVAAATWTRKT